MRNLTHSSIIGGLLLSISLILSPSSAKGQASESETPAPVFITAGQSNADGREWVSNLPSYLKGYSYKHLAFENVTSHTDGYFGAYSWGNRYAFCDIIHYLLDQVYDDTFYGIKCAYGGTAIAPGQTDDKLPIWYADSAWLSENTAYQGHTDASGFAYGKSLSKSLTERFDTLVDTTLSTLSRGYDVKAIFWHQGESDRNAAASYYTNFKTLIENFRRQIYEKTGDESDKTLPFIFGTVCRRSTQYNSAVEAAQRQVADDLENVYLIDMSHVTLRSDNLHFDSASTIYLGRAMFNQLVKLGIVDADTVAAPYPAYIEEGEEAMEDVEVEAEREWDFTEAWSDASIDSVKADSARWTAKSGWGYRFSSTYSLAELTAGGSKSYVIPETSGLYWAATKGNRITINPGSNVGFYAEGATVTIPKVKPGQYIYLKTCTANSSKERGLVPSDASNLDSIAGGYKSTGVVENVWWVQDTYTESVDATFQASGGGIFIYKIMVSDESPLATPSGVAAAESRGASAGGMVYSLTGQRVKSLLPGAVYIRGGRKILTR